MDAAAYARFAWRRATPSVLASLMIAVAVFLVASSASARYRAHALLSVSLTRTGSAGQITADASLFLAQSFVHLATTPQLLSDAAAAAHVQESVTALQRDVTVTAARDASEVTVTATQGSPARATALAQAEAEQLAGADSRQQQSQLAPLNDAIGSVVQQLSVLTPFDVQRSGLAGRYGTLVQATAGVLAAPVNRIAIVQPASATDAAKVSPRPARDAAIALALALFVNGMFIALLEAFSDRFPTGHFRAAVEDASGLPVLGEIARKDTVAESFREVRTLLLFGHAAPELGSVAVVGIQRKAGTSVAATGLASSLAALGRPVVLVDADLRSPALHTIYGLTRAPGVGDLLLAGTKASRAMVQPTDLAHLSVVTAGAAVDDPAGLLGERFEDGVLRPLAPDASVVVVDTAPAASYPDAFVVAAACASTVIVVDRWAIKRRALRATIDRLHEAHATPVGIVVALKASRLRRAKQQPVPPARPAGDEGALVTAAPAAGSAGTRVQEGAGRG